MRRAIGILALAGVLGAPAVARAGTFDALGVYRPDPAAVAYLDFETLPDRYLPDDADMSCVDPMFKPASGADALDGTGFLKLAVKPNCAERFRLKLPAEQGSYRATVWTRHGALSARIVVSYDPAAGLDQTFVEMGATGRTTSDGWVELASNDFPVDGAKVSLAYLRIADFADKDGVDIDSLEIVPSGVFIGQKDCKGLADPACTSEEVCTNNRCVLGRLGVPPLPGDALRNEVVDALESKLRTYYGGHRSRQLYLPAAIAAMEEMRSAPTAFRFWNSWAKGIHRLHDWHTDARGGPQAIRGSAHRLNACFFEGDADLSHGIWPKDAKYQDLLISHVGEDSGGLKAGDRLVAVDGLPPFDWAAALAGVNWGFHVATDPDNFADYAEALGGPYWTGGALIARYATNFTVIHCDAATQQCGLPETIAVTDLPSGGSAPDIACDNRPFYHLEDPNNPEVDKHYVFGSFFRGRVAGTKPEEAILGLVWDTLYGGGDPNGDVNKNIAAAVADFRANARGVILDHRAGNGGTLDSVKLFTELVRPPEMVMATRIPKEVAGYDGPNDATEGLAEFTSNAKLNGFTAGSMDHDPTLPVALIVHRDGSASDYFPFSMKGSPNVRIFGPHQTAGAFSTYVEFSGWGSFGFQIGSGETISSQGVTLIGHGVQPDVVILPKQSDLLNGKDTLFEAALDWVRQGLKP